MGEGSAADFLPSRLTLPALRKASASCRGCELWRDASRLLAEVLERAGIERDAVYLTNAVKHFKWRPRGKRRLHQTPRAGEVEACHPWLEAELEVVGPRVLIALGATAGKAIFGPSVRVTRDRGRLLESSLAPIAALTLHPSAVLRVREKAEREDLLAGMVADLEIASAALG